ncbi:pali-domain-containing protein [Dendrothele bispora CBS 962.96]|uniref:Pali-domain-containing protein n=1 Tax=Dendrothele bispora (strain CBS 962.96) TaxID=1314807 RepID=A0A4S8LC59_DENBC|nr:pali-domain-containing protein [Dendrothele bispora CBS 962.96]
MLSFFTSGLLFVAFLLLLLVSLSVPIIKTIFLFTLSANVSSDLLNSGASGSVNFGVWGYCISAVQVSIVGIDRDTTAQCSDRHLGYTIDSTVSDALHVDGLTNLISRTTTAALVLHPIACALTFVTLLVSLFTFRQAASRLIYLVTLGVGILAALFSTIVFLIDVILVAVVRNHVNDQTDGDLTLNWGNAVWMCLGATIALWLAMAAACAGVCGCGRRSRNRKETY